ncbi:hypothetical protein PA598K_04070 [Paenibacillus sp. 598K]|nr:hypothetical protein PA598K_04070 [Paenibacillus sp. 598K]
MCARWYDPGIGKFISTDTYGGGKINPFILNHYAYIHNNPMKMDSITQESAKKGLTRPSWVMKHCSHTTENNLNKYH